MSRIFKQSLSSTSAAPSVDDSELSPRDRLREYNRRREEEELLRIQSQLNPSAASEPESEGSSFLSRGFRLSSTGYLSGYAPKSYQELLQLQKEAQESGTLEWLGESLTTLASDVPAMVGGALAGGALGSTIAPGAGTAVGAGAGAFAAPAAIKAAYNEYLRLADEPNYKGLSFGDVLNMAYEGSVEGLKEGAIGALVTLIPSPSLLAKIPGVKNLLLTKAGRKAFTEAEKAISKTAIPSLESLKNIEGALTKGGSKYVDIMGTTQGRLAGEVLGLGVGQAAVHQDLSGLTPSGMASNLLLIGAVKASLKGGKALAEKTGLSLDTLSERVAERIRRDRVTVDSILKSDFDEMVDRYSKVVIEELKSEKANLEESHQKKLFEIEESGRASILDADESFYKKGEWLDKNASRLAKSANHTASLQDKYEKSTKAADKPEPKTRTPKGMKAYQQELSRVEGVKKSKLYENEQRYKKNKAYLDLYESKETKEINNRFKDKDPSLAKGALRKIVDLAREKIDLEHSESIKSIDSDFSSDVERLNKQISEYAKSIKTDSDSTKKEAAPVEASVKKPKDIPAWEAFDLQVESMEAVHERDVAKENARYKETSVKQKNESNKAVSELKEAEKKLNELKKKTAASMRNPKSEGVRKRIMQNIEKTLSDLENKKKKIEAATAKRLDRERSLHEKRIESMKKRHDEAMKRLSLDVKNAQESGYIEFPARLIEPGASESKMIRVRKVYELPVDRGKTPLEIVKSRVERPESRTKSFLRLMGACQ
jgi:hypothetical protein